MQRSWATRLPKIKHCTFSTLHRILIISCTLCVCGCFCSSHPCWNVICTITISYKISSNAILFKLPVNLLQYKNQAHSLLQISLSNTVIPVCYIYQNKITTEINSSEKEILSQPLLTNQIYIPLKYLSHVSCFYSYTSLWRTSGEF